MANSWFRFYAEFEDDPKVQMMPEHMQRRLALLFCERCKGEQRTEQQRAFKMHLTIAQLAETKACFIEAEIIDDEWQLLNWDKRQFTAEQKQQHRHADRRQKAGLSRRRWINPKVRERVMDRDGRACVYCNSCVNLTLDHMVSELRGGDNSEQNLVVACRPCNARKREFTLEQVQMSYRQGYKPPCQTLASAQQASTDTDTDTDTEQKQKQTQKQKEQKRAPKASPSSFELPCWISSQSWADFEEMRKKIRAPMTDAARHGIVASLEALKIRGHPPDAVLAQSVASAYRGVFELKNGGTNGKVDGKGGHNSAVVASFVAELGD